MTDQTSAAFLSREIYNDLTNGTLIGPDGRYKVLETSPIDSPSGYYGAVIHDTLTGDGFLVSRGTEPTSLADLQADLDLTFGGVGGQQFEAARGFLDSYIVNNSALPDYIPVTSSTGHSLGGFLSQGVGIAFNLDVISFGSPGAQAILNNLELAGFANEVASYAYSDKMFNFVAQNDPVGNFGQHLVGGNLEIVDFDPILDQSFAGYVDSAWIDASANLGLLDEGIFTIFNAPLGIYYVASKEAVKIGHYHSIDNYFLDAYNDSTLSVVVDLSGTEFSYALNGEVSSYLFGDTSSLEAVTSFELDVLLGFDGNEGWQNNFINTPDGSEYFIYQDTMVFRTTNGVKYEYEVFNFTDALFDNTTDHITAPSTNLWFDFGTDFTQGITDPTSNNSALDFENGAAIDGGNYQGTMPINIINGDGIFNTIPSGIITDEFRPGAGELASNETLFNDLNITLDNVMEGLADLGSSFVSGVAAGGLVGGLVTASSSLLTNLVSGAKTLLNIDPIVLDIDGDGVELVSFSNSFATFDVDNDGVIENTGWVHGDDALLVHDLNGDGIINNITETISEYYALNVGESAAYIDGLDALKTLDSNSDNVFDANDAAFGDLRVWTDVNSDARTDTGELKTLSDLGITSIDLTREVVQREELSGNPVLSRSTMIMNGVEHDVAAVDFTTNPVGYEWNDIAGGSIISLEDGSATSFIISDQTGSSADFASLNVDAVIGGSGDDVITGDSNNNWIIGNAGSDTMFGGDGDDFLIIDADDDLANIDGGSGFDVIKVEGNRGVVLNLSDINAEVAIGSNASDVIISGSTTNTFMRGGGGDDVLIGGSADDALSGEDGNDTVDGGLGDDILRGHRGQDLLIGDQGEDFLDGGLDDDELYGGAGEDLLKGGSGNDDLFGGDDYDVAEFSGKLDEYIVTAIGNGVIQVVDRVEGRDGTDILTDVEALNFQNIKEVGVNFESPFTVDDVIAISGLGPYTIIASDILANDLDYQGNALHLTELSNVVGGTAILDGNGDVLFTPDNTYNGIMSFKYKIADSQGNSGASAILEATGQSAEVQGIVYLKEDNHPDDPLFYDQWYLNDANVIPVWNDYTGKGVNVGVFEIGMVDINHPDLVDNLSQETIDYADEALINDHATLVSGVISSAKNDLGSIGVAYDANLSVISLESGDNPNFNKLVEFQNYDIVNNSWGFTTPFAAILGEDNAFKIAAAAGRDGLGTVVIMAAGNDRQSGDNANAHNLFNNKYTIAVGAINKNADLSSLEIQQDPFSNPGANILISGPGSNITSTSVLLENSNGSVFGNNFETTQGTSFATPLVSGVVALMIEANPDLGYRDVQEILAYSARIVSDQNTAWQTNGAINWNGGGLHFSHDYGFGNVDALAAVRLAETWGKQQKFDDEITYTVTGNLNIASIPDNGILTDSINIPLNLQPLTVEHVTVTIDFSHARFGDLIIKLISPNGTEGTIVNRLGVDPGSTTDTGHGAQTLEFDFGNVSAWGESAYGDWTLQVQDAVTGETGIINSWELELAGKLSDLDDIYVYTEELSTLNDAARLILSDISGDDTINAASIVSNMTLDLNAGSTSIIDGKTLTIVSGTIIERAISGDGNDTINGNAENNLLFGGRGEDILSGAAGNDWLIGSWGNDDLTGGSGIDRFIIRNGDTGITTIQDFSLTDDLISLGNYIGFSDISDLSISIIGSDAQIDLPDGQIVIIKNTDATSLSNSHFQFIEDFALHNIVLNVYEQTLTEDNDYFYYPKDGNNNPILDTTPQRIYGRGGDDTIFGNLGDDELHGGDGDDTLVGYLSSDDIAGGKDKLFGDAGDDTLYGAGEADELYGGDDNDILYGARGDDILFGGRGSDFLFGDEGYDVIHLEYGLNDVWGDNYNIDPNLWDGTVGNDTFIIHKWVEPVNGSIFGWGLVKDIIRDFNPLSEVVDIRDVQGATSFDELGMSDLNLNGIEYLRINLGNNDQMLTLQGINREDLSAGNFIFYENILPEAMSDTFITNEDTDLAFTTVNLLENDIDVEDGIPEFRKIVSGPDNGVLVENSSGNYLYTPNENYFGNDSFVYEVIDSHGATVTAAVNISVQSVNDAPNAVTDTFTGVEDQVLARNVLTNDTDSDGDVTTVQPDVITTAQGIVISLAVDGSFTYTPPSGFAGADSFSYTLLDSNGASDIATVNLTIIPFGDTFIGTVTAEVFDGGAGSDTVDYSAGLAVNIDLENGSISGGYADGDTLISIENIIGSNSSVERDWIWGDASANHIQGLDGADILEGGAGADIIDGGLGWDYSRYIRSDTAVNINLTTGINTGGHAEGDILIDIEAVVGSDFNDIITGGDNGDYIKGENGDDILDGGLSNDQLFGGEGNDTYHYSSGRDTLHEQGAGVDNVIFDASRSPLAATISGNVLVFSAGIDELIFNNISLFETFSFDGYADMTFAELTALISGATDIGTSGDDVLIGTPSIQSFDGLAGSDTVDYSTSLAGNKVDLLSGLGSEGDALGDSYISIENIIGSNVSTERDWIWGDDADNHIQGLDGADILEGRAGSDIIDGGAGWDYSRYLSSDAGVNINLETGVNTGGHAEGDVILNVEAIVGSNYNDTIYGGSNGDYLKGEVGDDVIAGGGGTDQLYGGNGADVFLFEALTAFNNVDHVRDFDLLENDMLNISDLLTGYDPLTDAISDFVQITDNGVDSNLSIDANGGADNFVQIATLYGATGLTDEEGLETSGNLITA